METVNVKYLFRDLVTNKKFKTYKLLKRQKRKNSPSRFDLVDGVLA